MFIREEIFYGLLLLILKEVRMTDTVTKTMKSYVFLNRPTILCLRMGRGLLY